MENVDFCFVVLHYKTADDTIECIKSIQKLSDRSSIVIVDNASNNGSIEKVQKMFESCDDIFIIKNKDNLGFAAGNNIGYKYARNVLKAKFIAISNNDIIVDSNDFITYCTKLFEKSDFFVMGPDIESMVDHGHQNPMKAKNPDPKRIRKEIARYKILYILNKIGIYESLRRKISVEKNAVSNSSMLVMQENVQLHGAFMVFSPNFIKKEEIAFRPGTFLYMEESILNLYCKKMGYKTIFSPDVKVFHKEDSSTNSLFTATREKRSFVFRNMVKSLKVYYKVLTENEERLDCNDENTNRFI